MPSAADVFLNAVSKQTGIDPGLLGYWINEEGTYAPRGTGGFNFLNLRPQPYDKYASVSPGRFEQFANVNDAITATVRRLRQPFMSALMNTVKAGGDPTAQWKAIQGTGWDIGNYAGTSFSPTTQISYPGPTIGGDGGAATVSSTPINTNAAVNFARNALGTPYVWGGESASGYDCSGLVLASMQKAGVHGLKRTTFDQFQQGTPVPQGQLQPGDVVFYKGSDSKTVNGKLLPGHEALYIGNGKIIQAPGRGGQVEISALNSIGDYMGARRFTQSADQGQAVASGASSAVGNPATTQAHGVASGGGTGGMPALHLQDPGAALMHSMAALPLLKAVSPPSLSMPPISTRPLSLPHPSIPPNPTSYLPAPPAQAAATSTDALPKLPPTFSELPTPSFQLAPTQPVPLQSTPFAPTTGPYSLPPPAFVNALLGK